MILGISFSGEFSNISISVGILFSLYFLESFVFILESFILDGFLVFIIFPRHSHAYLDPGTGSYMLQILLGFLLAAIFVIKGFWSKIKIFFSKLYLKEKRHDKSSDK